MGCSSSHNLYKNEAGLASWRNHLLDIGLRDKDVDYLYKLYQKLEGIESCNGNNLIHATTILDYIDVEPNRFVSRILSMLQRKEGGIIENFKQFCFSIWNFGTMGDASLEISNMVLMVHEAMPKDLDIGTTSKIIKKIQDTPKAVGTWNLDNFTKFVRSHTYLFHKIKVIQIKFRERIFGTSLWSKLINIRDTLGEEAVADLFLEVCPAVFDGFTRELPSPSLSHRIRGKETPDTLSNRTDTTEIATTSNSRRIASVNSSPALEGSFRSKSTKESTSNGSTRSPSTIFTTNTITGNTNDIATSFTPLDYNNNYNTPHIKSRKKSKTFNSFESASSSSTGTATTAAQQHRRYSSSEKCRSSSTTKKQNPVNNNDDVKSNQQQISSKYLCDAISTSQKISKSSSQSKSKSRKTSIDGDSSSEQSSSSPVRRK
eukprot:gene13084-27620_t